MCHKKTNMEYLKECHEVHGDRYDYSLTYYVNARTKVKIICSTHGIFEQNARYHIRGQGCPKCSGQGFGKNYDRKNITPYETYYHQIEPYGIPTRRSDSDRDILETRCIYCDRWFIPSKSSIVSKIRFIKGQTTGEYNLYCSDSCKHQCPTYRQSLYPKGFKPSTSREVQPQLRKMVFERDNFKCQRCGSAVDLHCHHITGVEVNPVESADIDNCVTLCEECHKYIHSQDGCKLFDYRRQHCKSIREVEIFGQT